MIEVKKQTLTVNEYMYEIPCWFWKDKEIQRKNMKF